MFVLVFQNKYRAKGIEAFKEYSMVIDTPTYETAKQSAQNLSDVSTVAKASSFSVTILLFYLTLI